MTTDPDPDPIALARSFNEGSDARLMGINQSACYYKHDKALKTWWNLGWDHCDKEWGLDAKWPVQPLREIPKPRKKLDD
jgi:hypothetical protein